MCVNEPIHVPTQMYEYTTVHLVGMGVHLSLASKRDELMAKQGWERAWADITMNSCYIVYRRKRT